MSGLVDACTRGHLANAKRLLASNGTNFFFCFYLLAYFLLVVHDPFIAVFLKFLPSGTCPPRQISYLRVSSPWPWSTYARNKKKADINSADGNGDTALIWAASRGYVQLVETLLRYSIYRTMLVSKQANKVKQTNKQTNKRTTSNKQTNKVKQRKSNKQR